MLTLRMEPGQARMLSDLGKVLVLPLLLATLLLTNACTLVGPDFSTPKAEVADNWLESGGDQVKQEPDAHAEWWKVFEDPVLDRLIETASKQNLELHIAGLRILEARAQLGVATGNLYPQLQQIGIEASAAGASKNAANTAFGDLDFKELGGSFDAAWELDFWGKFRRGVESADAQFLSTIAEYDDLLVTLTAETARAYILIRTLEQRIQLARENVSLQERSLEIADALFEGGLVTELDVQQAKNLLANTRALIPRLQTSLRQAQNGLAILLGIPPQKLGEELNTAAPLPQAPAEVAVGIPAELLRRRPDIRRAELQAAAQSALVGVARADLFPHFTLFGSIGLRSSESSLTRNGGSHFSDLFDSDSFEYFAGPSLSWDLFNYGRLKNRVRATDARLQQLIVNYRNTVLKAAQEVEDAMAGFLFDQQQTLHLDEAVAASRRSVELAMIQYTEGLVDYQRVLDTQRGLTSDQDALTEARGSVVLNLVSMYKALGGGWQIRIGRDPVPAEDRRQMDRRTDWGRLLKSSESRPEASDGKDRWRTPDW